MSENSQIGDNLKKFVLDVLKEDNITPYELSRRTGCNETLWKNFLDGRTKMPDSGAIVALADYKKVPLDKVVGRDLTKEVELETSKDIKLQNIKPQNIKPQIPAFITGLPTEALQSVMQVREDVGKFMHKSTPTSPNEQKLNEQKKSFADKERARQSNKPLDKSR